ncbi:DUF1043 family protein [Porticoccaceae bacterium LTM1]|nr:DUF1043 family protein [Porticoccaceae bacterium LTM1]
MTTAIIITALICLAVGAAIGILLTRLSHPEEKQRRELESRLQQAEDELKAYQQEVSTHFIKTASLVNNMTQSYRAVGEHLAASAMHLANPDISRQLLNAGSGSLTGSTAKQASSLTLGDTAPEPPKDYAPKAPGGILSEEYGLKEDYGVESRPAYEMANDDLDSEDDDDQDPTLKAV